MAMLRQDTFLEDGEFRYGVQLFDLVPLHGEVADDFAVEDDIGADGADELAGEAITVGEDEGVGEGWESVFLPAAEAALAPAQAARGAKLRRRAASRDGASREGAEKRGRNAKKRARKESITTVDSGAEVIQNNRTASDSVLIIQEQEVGMGPRSGTGSRKDTGTDSGIRQCDVNHGNNGGVDRILAPTGNIGAKWSQLRYYRILGSRTRTNRSCPEHGS
jgi:hypothetical protein